MTTVLGLFVYFFCWLAAMVVVDRLGGRGPRDARPRAELWLSFAGAALLWPLVWMVIPTQWGDPLTAFLIEQDGETRAAVVFHRLVKKGADWCAVRTFNLDGEEVGHTVWTHEGACTPRPGGGRYRWFTADQGPTTYRYGLVPIDLWTARRSADIDDTLEKAHIPGSGQIRARAVEGESLAIAVQDGTVRYLSPEGALEEEARPLDPLRVVAMAEPDRGVERAYGVFDVRSLGCGDLVLFRDVAFGEGPVHLGRTRSRTRPPFPRSELVWRRSAEELGLDLPFRGAMAGPGGCWVLGGDLVRIDEEGQVTARIEP